MNTFSFVKQKNRWIRPWILIFSFLCIWLGTDSVFSSDMKSSSLTSLIEEALQNNPEIKAMQAELKATQLKVSQSSALPDPTVGYAVMGRMLETPLGPQEDMYEFEQMIPFPAKLIEQRKMARAEAESADARLSKIQRDIILKVSETYYDLYSIQESLQTTQEVHALLNNFQQTAQSLYASLQGTQKDVIKAQIEASEVLQKIYLLRQQKQSLLGMLSALINRNIKEGELNTFPKLQASTETFELDELIAKAGQNRPELKEAASFLKRDQHANRLSKYEYAPDISVGFQYFGIGDGDTSSVDDGRDAWMIPIRFTIPLWQNRIVPSVKEAKQNLKASQARLKDVENLGVYEVKNAFYKFSASKDIVDLYEKVLIPQARLALNSDIAAYEAGKGDLLSLIDSERTFLDSKIAYYEALAESLKNFAALERIVGIDLAAKGGLK